MTATTAANMNVAPDRAAYWAVFRQMPLVLQAYAWFVCVAVVAWCAGMLLLLWPAANRAVLPYFSGMDLHYYAFTIYFAFSLPIRPRRRFLVFSLAALVSIGLWAGLFNMFLSLSDANLAQAASTNPHLRYEPLRAVISIVVPLFWIMMLLSPEVWRWSCGKDTVSRSRYAVLDLLYLVLVCAICTALSLGLIGHVRERVSAAKPRIRQWSLVGPAAFIPPHKLSHP